MNLKDIITEESINSLRKEGLRFSVDTLAEKLKISKKTIYKYFPTKEALAYAMYERYYKELNDKIAKAVDGKCDADEAKELLAFYFDSSQMVRDEIFNKYSLNSVIGAFASEHHLNIWSSIKQYICKDMSEEESQIYKLIVDGAFDKAISCNTNIETVIKMLRKMI